MRTLSATLYAMESRESVRAIARALLTRGKGILAADESVSTMDKRLEAVGAGTTPEMRR